jgi:hypothetical protein
VKSEVGGNLKRDCKGVLLKDLKEAAEVLTEK